MFLKVFLKYFDLQCAFINNAKDLSYTLLIFVAHVYLDLKRATFEGFVILHCEHGFSIFAMLLYWHIVEDSLF